MDPFSGIKIPKWRKTLKTLLVLVHCFKILVVVALNHLGFLKTPHQMTESSEEQHRQNPNGHILVFDPLCQSIVPVPIHVLTAYIKRLPVVEFGRVFEKYTKQEDEETECSICLECIERSHEVREQCNCNHLFHGECLDGWVNQGQVTCPLCRALLFPATRERTNCGGVNVWTLGRDACFESLIGNSIGCPLCRG